MAGREAPIYLDHQATTPLDERVLAAMMPYFGERFGNAASRSHAFGHQAEQAVERARVQVAALCGARRPSEIVFTSGATESDNLALKGAARSARQRGEARDHLVTTAIEHPAVLGPLERLSREGFSVTVVPVGADGLVDPDAVGAALTDRTLLASVMLANNEVGTVQPIESIGALCAARGVILHCDAAQGLGHVPFDVERMNVGLCSLSAHKLYGPKGVGALYVRSARPHVRLLAELDGGGHERGLRSGTANVPGIVGFGAACELMQAGGRTEPARIGALRDRLCKRLKAALGGVTLLGAQTPRLCGNAMLAFAGVQADALLVRLDGIALSTGSACSSASAAPSRVLFAMGLGEEVARSAVRFGLGRHTTEGEIDVVVDEVVRAVRQLRAS
jgi:cysteine desulfurase